jgi:hypothetical protein
MVINCKECKTLMMITLQQKWINEGTVWSWQTSRILDLLKKRYWLYKGVELDLYLTKPLRVFWLNGYSINLIPVRKLGGKILQGKLWNLVGIKRDLKGVLGLSIDFCIDILKCIINSKVLQGKTLGWGCLKVRSRVLMKINCRFQD